MSDLEWAYPRTHEGKPAQTEIGAVNALGVSFTILLPNALGKKRAWIYDPSWQIGGRPFSDSPDFSTLDELKAWCEAYDHEAALAARIDELRRQRYRLVGEAVDCQARIRQIDGELAVLGAEPPGDDDSPPSRDA